MSNYYSLDNDVVGEALIALKHDELKEMGVASVGHRLTILKSVYETKVKQDIPIDADHYVPLCKNVTPLAFRERGLQFLTIRLLQQPSDRI